MSVGDESSSAQEPPGWAVQQAAEELYDVDDDAVVLDRARVIAQQAQELQDERHDQYDDPDEGGEG